MNLPIKLLFWRRNKRRKQRESSSSSPSNLVPEMLPNGAIKIQYLETFTDGCFYINSGVELGNDFQSAEIQSKLQFSSSMNDRQIHGAENRFYFGVNNGRWEWDYQKYEGTADANVHVMKKDIAKVNNKINMHVYLDDTLLGQILTENWQNAFFKDPIGIFNYNAFSNVGFQDGTRLYWEKIYYNGQLVRDFIPVRVGNVGYLYDMISEELFSTVGPDQFILGPDVLTSYTEIKYLESNGTQYIELPFGFDKTDEIYTTFSVNTTEISDKYMIASKQWNTAGNRFGIGTHLGGGAGISSFTFGYGNVNTGDTLLQPYTANDGKLHNWQYKNYVCTITDLHISKDVSNIGFGNTTSNIKLFYGYNANTKGKMKSYKHIKNNEVVVDLIAVRIGQTGYLYDKVSKQLFGNMGTGNFILGPDK